jgi:3-oxoacyl-[acyl-carrier-protein] synthase III
MRAMSPPSDGPVKRARLIGSGSYLPAQVLTNADLAARLDTSDEWIVERTGIRRRHIAAADEFTSDLGVAAARNALESAGMTASEIDLIVVATATPDQTFPACATVIQHKLGIIDCVAFDIAAVCSGFLYALSVADALLTSGAHRTALVIGAETFSRLLDWEDRGTAVLFGDGAGAVVMRAETGTGTSADRGILAHRLHSDGRYNDLLYVDGGPGSTGTTGKLRMKGREVFRHAVTNLASVMGETLAAAGLAPGDVDWVVPHQANLRILEATARKLDLPIERVVVTVDRHANTSAASVPLALDTAVRDGRIKTNDLLLLEAMGGGFTWGAAAVRW